MEAVCGRVGCVGVKGLFQWRIQKVKEADWITENSPFSQYCDYWAEQHVLK